MYIVINANKGRYDRKINIYKPIKFNTPEQAGEYLKNILCGWLRYYNGDSQLLEKLDYDLDKFEEEIRKRTIKGIDKQIKRGEFYIKYSEYNSFEFDYDECGNLTMITTGCPADNEYIGETYQVIDLRLIDLESLRQ